MRSRDALSLEATHCTDTKEAVGKTRIGTRKTLNFITTTTTFSRSTKHGGDCRITLPETKSRHVARATFAAN
jgi:hypothetical protein